MLQKHPPTHPTPVEGKIHLVNFFDDSKNGTERITYLVSEGTTLPGRIRTRILKYVQDPQAHDQRIDRQEWAIDPDTGEIIHSRSITVVGTELAQKIVATLLGYFSDPKTADERIRGMALQRRDVDEILNGTCPCRVMAINIEESKSAQLTEHLFVVIFPIDFMGINKGCVKTNHTPDATNDAVAVEVPEGEEAWEPIEFEEMELFELEEMQLVPNII